MRPQRSTHRLFLVAVLTATLMLAVSLGVACGDEDPAVEATPGDGVASPAVTDTPTTTATPTPTTQGATHTIGDILASPVEGQRVVLVGTIALMQGAEDFTLDDGTGQIYVDGDDDFLPLAGGDEVAVEGVVDVEDSPSRVEIDATAVTRL